MDDEYDTPRFGMSYLFIKIANLKKILITI